MILSHDNQRLEIPGKNVNVAASLSLVRSDLSGNSSKTDFANAGNKGVVLAVALQLPFEEQARLGELKRWAIALDAAGDPVEYGIVDEIARALDVRNVIFSGNFKVAKSDNLQAFDVSFELQEVDSVAEKIEAAAENNTNTPSGAWNLWGTAAQINENLKVILASSSTTYPEGQV